MYVRIDRKSYIYLLESLGGKVEDESVAEGTGEYRNQLNLLFQEVPRMWPLQLQTLASRLWFASRFSPPPKLLPNARCLFRYAKCVIVDFVLLN